MTANDPTTLLMAMYRSFNARDIEAVLTALHSSVDWPNGMEGGRVLGHEAVRAYWTRQFAMIDSRVEPLAFEVSEDGRTVVDVLQVVRDLNGKLISDSVVQHVFTIDDGLVIHMEIRKS